MLNVENYPCLERVCRGMVFCLNRIFLCERRRNNTGLN